jgi:hypothetical protein
MTVSVARAAVRSVPATGTVVADTDPASLGWKDRPAFEGAEVSEDELEKLRALGYVN